MKVPVWTKQITAELSWHGDATVTRNLWLNGLEVGCVLYQPTYAPSSGKAWRAWIGREVGWYASETAAKDAVVNAIEKHLKGAQT